MPLVNRVITCSKHFMVLFILKKSVKNLHLVAMVESMNVKSSEPGSFLWDVFWLLTCYLLLVYPYCLFFLQPITVESFQECIIPSTLIYFEREKERERTRAGEGQRGRERKNPKQAPHCEHGAQCRAPTHKQWDHDLSRNPKTNLVFSFFPSAYFWLSMFSH